jgi:hypothetical protein
MPSVWDISFRTRCCMLALVGCVIRRATLGQLSFDFDYDDVGIFGATVALVMFMAGCAILFCFCLYLTWKFLQYAWAYSFRVLGIMISLLSLRLSPWAVVWVGGGLSVWLAAVAIGAIRDAMRGTTSTAATPPPGSTSVHVRSGHRRGRRRDSSSTSVKT